MRNSIKTGAFAAAMLFGSAVYSQSDSLGLPGDDLDLNAVLSIFKQSSSIEDFEKKLNAADTKINNLDLNNDQQVDYLRVVDYGKDDFHSIVIQDPVSKTESQDIAVIEVVKKGNETAHIQIVGDETLYGKNYIIEPADQAQVKSTAKNNNNNYDDDAYNTTDDQTTARTHVMINVWGWPSVSYLYAPGYTYYVSPWYWGYYPGWYSPWRPYGGWYAYHNNFIGYNYGFYGYRRYHYAFPHAHNYYYGHRMSSGYVQKTAPHYGRRTSGGGDNINRGGQRTTNGNQRDNNIGPRNKSINNNNTGGGTRVRNGGPANNRSQVSPQQGGNQQASPRVRSGGQNASPGSNPGRGQMQNGGGQRVNNGGSAPRMGGGNSGGGMRSGGGGGRTSGGGGGGGGRR